MTVYVAKVLVILIGALFPKSHYTQLIIDTFGQLVKSMDCKRQSLHRINFINGARIWCTGVYMCAGMSMAGL